MKNNSKKEVRNNILIHNKNYTKEEKNIRKKRYKKLVIINNKILNNNSKNNILIILYFFLLFLDISFTKKNFYLRIINSMEEIILTVNGPGTKKIFGDYFDYLPDRVVINEDEITTTIGKAFELEDDVNIIKLYYNRAPPSLKNMFKGSNNIVKADFSHFGSSGVNDMSYMFHECEYLEEINFSNIKTSSVTNMESMFQNCKKLQSLDLSNFDTSNVINMKNMFNNCEKLEYLDISSFDTSSVQDMSRMISYCKELKAIDISNFRTNNANMNEMFHYCLKLKSIKFPDENNVLISSDIGCIFQDCQSITYLDLSSFDTSSCTNMEYSFNNCYKIVSINLSNIITSNVRTFNNMFSYCGKLEALDLTNFETFSVTTMTDMFTNCNKLIYINLESFIINETTNIDNIFNSNYPQLTNDCSFSCFSEPNKLISEDRKCVENCSSDNTYKYEYNNKCYSNCPDGTISSEDNEYICKVCKYYNMDKTKCFNTIPEGYFLSDNTQNLIDKCHDNCKTCDKKEIEGNTNCLTCQDNLFFDNGNCLDSCTYGSYRDDSGKNVCNCNAKCKECSTENENLCKSCREGYYPIYVENINENTLLDCYNTLEGYYLNINYFYPCYDSCKQCYGSGDRNNHNCEICRDGYSIINELNKEKNCYEICQYYYYFESDVYKCTQTNSCPNNKKKIEIKRKCIDECSYDDIYINEYNNECLINCPEGFEPENNKCIEKKDIMTTHPYIGETTVQTTYTEPPTSEISEETTVQTTYTEQSTSQSNEETTVAQTTYTGPSTSESNEETAAQTTYTEPSTSKSSEENTDKPTSKSTQSISITSIVENSDRIIPITNIKPSTTSEISEISQNWSSENFFSGLYKKYEQGSLDKDDIIKNIRDDIINRKLDTLIKNVKEEKEDKIMLEDNTLYQITTSENQNNNIYTNISSIKLGECENILKKKYDIDENDTLIILKIDYNITGLLIPIIGYEVFHPKNKSKLDLSYCEESSINYNIPVTIDENNLFKYDQNSDYYNDECNTYTTENGTDIILNDRKKEFTEKNMSLCENICEYAGYNSETKKAICECDIRYKDFLISEINNQTDLLANNLTIDNSTSNIGAVKCYELLFSKEGLLTNFGSYILIAIIVFHLISIFIFYKCGFQIIENNLEDIIDEKKSKKKSETKEKKVKSRKSNIYALSKKNNKLKKKASIFKKIEPRKSNKLKSIKSFGNPLKKLKKKSSRKLSVQEYTNISNNNNQKSISKLNMKESKFIPKYPKRKTLSFKSLNINKSTKMKFKPNVISFLFYNDFELNTMSYADALEIDKRTFQQYYISLLRVKQYICFSFFPIKDYNVFIIKICLFFLSFAIYYAFNTLFFNYTIIHELYENGGSYNLSFVFPSIIYSFIISYHVNIVIKYVTLSERNILEVKNEKTIKLANKKKIKVKRFLIVKSICYFVISLVFLLLFWYYLSSFCAVYKNSQKYLIKNTFISYGLGLLYPLLINIIPVIFRKIALNNKNRECIYNTSKFLQIL